MEPLLLFTILFFSYLLYRLAKLLSLWIESLAERGKCKFAKLLTVVLLYPFLVLGVLGMVTLGVLDHIDSNRLYRRHISEMKELRSLVRADTNLSYLEKYRIASFAGAPGASEAYEKLNQIYSEYNAKEKSLLCSLPDVSPSKAYHLAKALSRDEALALGYDWEFLSSLYTCMESKEFLLNNGRSIGEEVYFNVNNWLRDGYDRLGL